MKRARACPAALTQRVSVTVLAAAIVLAACHQENGPAETTPQQGGLQPSTQQAPAGTPSPAELARLERGVGLMGKFDFDAARVAFAALVAEQPAWFEARFDLALATLNRQGEGDEASARQQLNVLLKERPDDLRVQYVLGLLELHGQSAKQAEALLRRVHDADSRDAYACYFLGQAVLAQGRAQEALDLFAKAASLDPQLRSAHYAAALALGRLGRNPEAEVRMAEFQRQSHNPLARLAEFKYTRMGEKSEAVGATPASSAAQAARGSAVPPGALFAEPRIIAPARSPARAGKDAAPSAAIWAGAVPSAADIDGDGAADIFLPGGAGQPSTVLRRRSDGFQPQPDHPLAKITGVSFAAWGDIDNDGLVDVLLCRPDAAPILARQAPRGTWRPLDIAPLRSLRGARDCMLLDADHDGDLDMLIVTANGQRVLLNNNGDGSFRVLSGRLPAPRGNAPATQLVAGDLDNDRAVDLVVLHQGGEHEVIANELMWDWRRAAGFDRFVRSPALAAAAADLDVSGELDLVTLDPALAIQRWQRGADGTWQSRELVAGTPLASNASPVSMHGRRPQLAVADVDGDGKPEIVATSSHGISIWRPSGDKADKILDIDDPTIVAWQLVTLDSGGPSLLTVHANGSVALRLPGPGRSKFVRIALSGRDDPAASIRSNASGIGARLAARIDGRWVTEQTLRQSSGPGQSLVPLAVGLGGAASVDYVRIDWSDGVFQTETDLAAESVQRIVETQRQLSSCPLIFAWDGQRYAFVSDFLGVGGLGYLVAPGLYATPRPWENFLFPDGLLQARGGRYAIKVNEPMEEAAYIDALRLKAYDLPPGWQMALDERMQINAPKVTGRPLYFRTVLLPRRAIDDRGEDVTAAVRTADRIPADPGELDGRFIGRLAHEYALTLEFDEDLAAGAGTPVLLADGWIEYPYSQTMFAAWQAHASYDAPTLEARGGDGVWRIVLKEFGYPAGMPRTMAVPLPPLPPGTRALRLRTTQEIYWDRLAIARAEPLDAVVHHLPLVSAVLGRSGFPRRTTGAHHQPSYDYLHRAPLWDTRMQAGNYTDFGRIDALVSARDDALAIIGPGEEIDAAFDAALPPVAAGWTRRFVLESNGWAKDMDLYTRDGNSLAPLPRAGVPSRVADQLHRRYNRRVADE